ncbi:MAG: ATPase, partial [Candidatus Dadabacteria bacterium]
MGKARLHFVVGKGGVGKSTVAAALALAHAGRGRRVLAVELGGPGGLARLFGVVPSAPGHFVRAGHRLWLGYVDGQSALAEYLELVIPIRRLLATVFASRIYKNFVAAAPGLKELMTVGKIWYEFHRTGDDQRPVWDAIVVDAGASGHSLQYLQMPAVAARTFRSGLVHRESERVASLLRDRSSTRVHVVAIAEEMPLTEARQIVERLDRELGLP